MKNIIILTFCSTLLLFTTTVMGQKKANHQFSAIKTNVVAASFGNINAAAEILITPNFKTIPLTLNLPVSYNPFTGRNNEKLKHIAFQPELRMWLNPNISDFFIGLHAHYAYYNVGGVLGSSKRYQGNLYGAGVSGGYKYRLGNRFGLEASLGLGYARMDYEEFRCSKCGTKTGENTKNYFGPTKAALSIVYAIH